MSTNITQQRAQSSAARPITSDRVYQGAVLWLPRRQNKLLPRVFLPQVGVERVAPNNWWSSTDKDIYAHPILVLSRPSNDPSRIHFLLLTSLGDKKGRRKEHDPRVHSDLYLPIEPAEGHTGSENVRLRYRFGRATSTRGYVSFESIYSMKWNDTQLYAALASDGSQDEGIPWELEPMHVVLDWVHTRRKEYRLGREFSPSPGTNPSVVMPVVPTARPRSLIARVGERVVLQSRNSLKRLSSSLRRD